MNYDLKNEYKIVFVILNFETYWETYKCVDSIQATFPNCGKYVYEIVIVDNGSNNDSSKRLHEKYISESQIYVLDSGGNLGFAKGNNIGFQFAKENLHPDFILMINSDVIMTDKYFIENMIKNYEKTKFDVAGPDITLKDGNRINPFVFPDLSKIETKIKRIQFNILLTKLKVDPLISALNRIPKYFSDRRIAENLPTESFLLNDKYALHGCFLIFSKHYIDVFDGLYDKTFLYEEEILLKLRCERAGMKMWFLSDLKALHNESQTEKYIGGKVNEKHRRRYINVLNSMVLVKEYIESEDLL